MVPIFSKHLRYNILYTYYNLTIQVQGSIMRHFKIAAE